MNKIREYWKNEDKWCENVGSICVYSQDSSGNYTDVNGRVYTKNSDGNYEAYQGVYSGKETYYVYDSKLNQIGILKDDNYYRYISGNAVRELSNGDYENTSGWIYHKQSNGNYELVIPGTGTTQVYDANFNALGMNKDGTWYDYHKGADKYLRTDSEGNFYDSNGLVYTKRSDGFYEKNGYLYDENLVTIKKL